MLLLLWLVGSRAIERCDYSERSAALGIAGLRGVVANRARRALIEVHCSCIKLQRAGYAVSVKEALLQPSIAAAPFADSRGEHLVDFSRLTQGEMERWLLTSY